MTSGNSENEQIQRILRRALNLSSVEERAAFLDKTCGSDPALHQKVEQLVRESLEDRSTVLGLLPGDSPRAPASEKPGETIGRYKLLEQIGEGGFGSVYMAEQREPVTRRVALKIVKAGMDSKEVIARFEAERQALAMMDNPNIAKVFDAGTTESGRPYFVMELVNGIPITKFCDERRLNTRQRLDIFLDVCSATQHAHQKGIIHRDLKPSNVLVTLHGDEAVPKVIDFGIAKATQQQLTDKTVLTRFEQFVGTPVYMSPEQALHSGLDIDTRSDIYSLGVLLYELLTGRPPFDAKSLLSAGYEEMRRIIREEEPPKPSSRLSTMAGEDRTTVARHHHSDPERLGKLVRGDLDWIVMKAMEKDRSRRYETANALAQDVRRHLSDEPVLAAAPTLAYRLQKFVRRNRTTVVVGTTIGILLVVGIAVSTSLAMAATRAKNSETEAKGKLQAQLGQTREAEARESAQRIRAEETVQRLQIKQAENHIQVSDLAAGLAYLASVIRTHPSNRVAASRMMDLMIYREWPHLLFGPIQHDDSLQSVHFSADGLRLVTASGRQALLWDARTGKPVGAPLDHEVRVKSARFDPSGKRVLTVGSDKAARVWDVRSGQPVGAPMYHESAIRSAEFSPKGDCVATASEDHTACLWEAQTGRRIGEPMLHDDWVFSVEFSRDGQRVVTASRDHTARVWSALTGLPLGEPMQHKSSISSARFSPDGKRILTISYDSIALLWNAATSQQIGMPMPHRSRILSAQFSPDGRRVVTATFGNMAHLWDGHTGQPVGEPMMHQGAVWSADFSPDGQRLVTASRDKTARHWDARTGKPKGEPMLHPDVVQFARFSPDGRRVATAAGDHAIRVWDVRVRPRGEAMHHGAGVRSAEFSPDGQRVVTASYDKTARLWNAQTSQSLGGPLTHGNFVESARFSPGGDRVLTACVDHQARLWDVQTGQQLLESMRAESAPVLIAKFSPRGDRIITVDGQSQVRVWDAQSAQPVGKPMRHQNRIFSVDISSNGGFLVTASADKTAQVWDLHTSEAIGEPMPHEDFVNSAVFSPDGHRVLTASNDKTVRFWDARTGQALGEPIRNSGFRFLSARFSPDGQRVVTVSDDHTARLWRNDDRTPLGAPMRHGALITSVHFSADGERVVTASHDNSARIWDAFTGEPLGEAMRHAHWISSARFSPGGNRVITASHDATARIWETPHIPLPVPPWVADWAEAVGGKRLSNNTQIETATSEERRQLQEQIASGGAADFYSRAARWYYADPTTRTISPWSSVSLDDYVRRRIDEGTPESLREALDLSSVNGTVLAKLAILLLSEDSKTGEGALEEAGLYARLAVRWSPGNAESWRALAEMHWAGEDRDKALSAVEQSLELEPGASWTIELKKRIMADEIKSEQ